MDARSPQMLFGLGTFGRRYLFFQLGGQTSQAVGGTCGGERPPPLSFRPSVGRFDYKSFIVRSPSPPSIDVGVIVLPSCTKGYPPFCLWHLYSCPLPSLSSFLIRLFISLGEAAFSRHSPEVQTEPRPIARRPTMPLSRPSVPPPSFRPRPLLRMPSSSGPM